MYHLVSSKVKNDFSNGDWLDTDISALTIRQIIDQFKIVHLTLTNDVLLGNRYADLHQLVELPIMNFSMTIPDWLTSIGNASIIVTAIPYVYKHQTVVYGDAFQSLFDIKKVHPNFDPEVEVPEDDKIDLMLEKANVESADFVDYCLVSVNGLIHFTEATNRGIYVRGGAEMTTKNEERNVGIYSFGKVGKITLKPFSQATLYTPNVNAFGIDGNNGAKYSESIVVDVGVNLSNKSILFSLGGYLHAMDNTYKIVGESTIKIDFRKIPFVRRLIESRKLINLDSLGLTENQFNDTAMAVDEILSDEVIEAYFNLSQSFLIIIDSPNVYVQRYIMENGRLPGIYFHPETTNFPMMIDNGRLAEYLEVFEEGKTQYRINKNDVKKYMFETINWYEQILVDNSKQIHEGNPYADAFLLEIGAF